MKTLSTIDLSYENQLIKNIFMLELSALYDTNLLVSSPIIEEVEELLADRCGTTHCCLTGAGTMALQLAATAVGVKPGDEVVVPANTFLASAVAMYHAGARIVLADVDPKSWNLSYDSVKKVITPNTKAICLVHLYGNVADPQEFISFDVPVIEDASHAFGGTLRGRKVGSLGAVAGFSAGPIKGFGGLGQAGFITYNDDSWRHYLNAYVNNGQTSRHFAEIVGHNYRIDAVNALFLRCKLAHWTQLLAKRRQLMAIYDELFAAAGIVSQYRLPCGEASLWVYVIRLEASIRDRVAKLLKQKGIETIVQYTFSINQLPIWPEIAAKQTEVPFSEQLTREVLSLPVHPGITVEDAQLIARSVIETVDCCRKE